MLEAYSPFGAGSVFECAEMQELSKKYNKSIAQICTMWSLQNGFLPLPKSVTQSRIKDNTDVFGFTLEDKDVELIASLKDVCVPTRNPDLIEF